MTQPSVVPVTEEARQFDHWDRDAAIDPYPLLGRLRGACPVARSDRHGGFWVYTRYEHVAAALRDHQTYSSTSIMIPKLKGFLAAVSEFQLADPDGVAWKPGPIRGPRHLALRFAGE